MPAVLYHLLESVTTFYFCTASCFIRIDSNQYPIRLFLNKSGVVLYLCFKGIFLFCTASADTAVGAYPFGSGIFCGLFLLHRLYFCNLLAHVFLLSQEHSLLSAQHNTTPFFRYPVFLRIYFCQFRRKC